MIGIFDSGCGGLTVLKAIREELTTSDVVYFGDTKNAPYGLKSQEELSLLTVSALKFLKAQGATSIVSACNSVSASLAVSLFDLMPEPVIEMVGPTVGYFRNSSARLLLCATPATIRSGIYQNGFGMLGTKITTLAFEKLAGAIETGVSTDGIEAIIREAVKDVDWEAIDGVVLACTHYPLVMESFRKVIPERIAIIDPARAVAEKVGKQFFPREVGDKKTRFILSKDSKPFRQFVSRLFPDTSYEVEVLD